MTIDGNELRQALALAPQSDVLEATIADLLEATARFMIARDLSLPRWHGGRNIQINRWLDIAHEIIMGQPTVLVRVGTRSTMTVLWCKATQVLSQSKTWDPANDRITQLYFEIVRAAPPP